MSQSHMSQSHVFQLLLLIMCKIPSEFAAVSEFICNFATDMDDGI